MEHRFDTLAKSLAGSISRREALSRVGGGIAGLLLATVGLGRAWSAPATNSQCEDFCRSTCGISPGGGNAFGKCVSSCEACVNSTGSRPCGCPASLGADVVCTNCCIQPGSSTHCTSSSDCCSGVCRERGSVCCLETGCPCTSDSQCCSGFCKSVSVGSFCGAG